MCNMTIFPMIQPQIAEARQLPLCRDVLWDAAKGIPVFQAGEPVIVQGAQAVASWVWRALRVCRYRHELYTWDYGSELEGLIGQAYTAVCRYRHELYTWDYGSELEGLIGQAYTAALKQAEARRYVEEALAVNPYIQAVRQIQTEFDEAGRLLICGVVDTVYGPIEIGGDMDVSAAG